MPARESFAILNSLDELETLRSRVEAFGKAQGFGLPVIFEVNLVLDELITNIISYAYCDCGPHRIEVDLERKGDELTMTVCDDGVPFNPLSAKEPDIRCCLEQRKVGGLGIHLARKIIDEMHYERRGGRNMLVMTKHLDESGRNASG